MPKKSKARKDLMEYLYGNAWSKEEILELLLSYLRDEDFRRILRELERMDSQ